MNAIKAPFLGAVIILLSSFCLTSAAQTTDNSTPQLGKSPVKAVVAAMTLEEKTMLVVGASTRPRGGGPGGARPVAGAAAPATPPGPVIGQTQQLVPGAAGTTFAIPRLGIPAIVLSDGPAGLRINPKRPGDSVNTYYCTAFPIETLLASTWDPATVTKVGHAMGNEVLEYGADVLLAPALNIHRNPLGGRNFEYYSEDPLVAGKMAAAMVNGIQSQGVGTSIKHFMANNQETNRGAINTILSERASREIYLRGFKIAVQESDPWTVMSSYNKVNGTYTSERPDLLYTILRKEWGFKGLVMTDWFGGRDAVAQMKSSNDLLMPGSPAQAQKIAAAVKDGTLDIKILDANVERILNLILKTQRFKGYKYSNHPNLKENAQVSREAATEGMVLLKNTNHALPMAKKGTVAVFGNTSYDIIAGGTGSGDVNKAYTISLVDGLGNSDYKVDDSLKSSYTKYLAMQAKLHPRPVRIMQRREPIAEMPLDSSMIQREAKEANVAIITIGRISGEGQDRKLDDDFYLSVPEKNMIKKVTDAFHAKGKKAIVILNIGGVIETVSWRDNADGILLAWQPGQEAGNAIAEVLSGKVDPSGKLATTFPVDYKDVPSAKSFPGTPEGKPDQVVYEDGIYVGYRYYDTYKINPAYEFGYGLSYTNFSISSLKLSSLDFKGHITATVNVTNIGQSAGKQVVQLYLRAPSQNIDKPDKELKGFAKTKLLQPGASQTLTFTINASDLASYYTNKASWIADAGEYNVIIGTSSRQIKTSATFKLAKAIVTEKVENELVPQVPITELKGK